jgi:hypothetical protein
MGLYENQKEVLAFTPYHPVVAAGNDYSIL